MSKKPWTWEDTLVATALVLIVLLLCGLRAHFVYGDWKCGMPGVHCMKVKK
jgi:hypothetical protein